MGKPLSYPATKVGTVSSCAVSAQAASKFLMEASVAYPVQVLRARATALEAAIAACLAEPEVRPVHRLRTETRRVEALLVLLTFVPGLPRHKKEAERLRRVLRRLRRAAGHVRDLDVHRKMLEVFAAAEASVQAATESRSQPAPDSNPNPAGNTGTAAATDELAAAHTSDPVAEETARLAAPAGEAGVLSEAAHTLRHHMGHKRETAAVALCSTLAEWQGKANRATEALLKALQGAEDLALPGQSLLQDAESLLSRDGLLGTDVARLSRDQLHTVRKAAKAARYVAESLPGDAAVADAARRFEALQEAGGQWHDAWQLARAARRRFGKAHALTRLYRTERDQRLAAYREALANRTGKPASQPSRPSAKAKAHPTPSRRTGAKTPGKNGRRAQA